MHRDLEELRAKRFLAENPPIPEVLPDLVEEKIFPVKEEVAEIQQPPQTAFKQEKVAPEAPMIAQDAPKEIIPQETTTEGAQGPSPPSSIQTKQEPAGLSIKTETATSNDISPVVTNDIPDSAIDSLFDTSENLDNAADVDLNFDTMDFLVDSNTHDNSQTQNTEFDLSTFGNNTSEFNMTELQVSNEPGNTKDTTMTNNDDLFGLATDGGGDLMDLDNTMRPAEESSFDDLFFMGEDDGIGGGGSNEMEHGAFDENFFNLSWECITNIRPIWYVEHQYDVSSSTRYELASSVWEPTVPRHRLRFLFSSLLRTLHQELLVGHLFTATKRILLLKELAGSEQQVFCIDMRKSNHIRTIVGYPALRFWFADYILVLLDYWEHSKQEHT